MYGKIRFTDEKGKVKEKGYDVRATEHFEIQKKTRASTVKSKKTYNRKDKHKKKYNTEI